MLKVLDEGTRKARKEHRCFHCYRHIAKGETYGFSTCKYDYFYTLRFHQDCDELWREYEKDIQFDWGWHGEGSPPLKDQWVEDGEFEHLCDHYRGRFPHAVCRMELGEQLRHA